MHRIPITPPGLRPLVAAALLASAAGAQSLKSTLVQGGFSMPVFVTSPPGDAQRLFVVQHAGQIRIIKNGVTLATPFLDIDPIVGGGQSPSDERGLLGLAFHPNFAGNRKLYVSFTDNGGSEVIREYLADAVNPDVADASSFNTILGPIADPQSNHNGGGIAFGPDGKLYYGLGDGGGSCDQHALDGNGQSLSTYMGKFLRLDVDNPPSYVPAGNPFGASSFPLIWSYGWRNPWRWSFDRQTGDMYVGDVGQNQVEEIDFQPASSAGGENYGWRCFEGGSLSSVSGCSIGPCNGNPAGLTFPIHTYGHGTGCTVVGGYVYRGTSIPGLAGTYFFADYCNARIWSFAYNGTVQGFTERTSQLNTGQISSISSFGEDAAGELYICDYGGGEIYRIDQVCPLPTSYCVAAPNSAGAGATMSSAGTGSIAANDLVVIATGCPSRVNGIFFYGDGQTQAPLGNGFRCVASNFVRLPAVQTNLFGDATWDFDVTGAPPGSIAPGVVKNFQLWYRDVAGGGALFNVSNGLAVTFCAN